MAFDLVGEGEDRILMLHDFGHEAEEDIPPGMFRCDNCGGVFEMGSEEKATLEAAVNGFDVEESCIICDACYALTPMGAPPGTN